MSDMKRRSMMKGIAWATPSAVVSATAPVYESSVPATGVVLMGDAGVSDECWGSPVTYDVDPKAGDEKVKAEIAVQTNNVAISFDGDTAPSVADLTATLYLNASMDIFSRFPSSLEVSNYGDEGAWSDMVRADDVEVNGETFIVYTSHYAGDFIQNGSSISPVDAGWDWFVRSTDPDDVERAQGPIYVSDVDSFNANKGALVFTATVGGQEKTSDPVADALAAQGSALWVSRLSTFAECRYVSTDPDVADEVLACEGYPGAPDPYPAFPGRSVERSARRVCEKMEAGYIRG